MARGRSDKEGTITSGGIETNVEGFFGNGVTGDPPMAMEYGPLKEPGSGGLPIKTGGIAGAKSSGIYQSFQKKASREKA